MKAAKYQAVVQRDIVVLATACAAIQQLKIAQRGGKARGHSEFTALDGAIEDLEQWATWWADESGFEGGDATQKACATIIRNYRIGQ